MVDRYITIYSIYPHRKISRGDATPQASPAPNLGRQAATEMVSTQVVGVFGSVLGAIFPQEEEHLMKLFSIGFSWDLYGYNGILLGNDEI